MWHGPLAAVVLAGSAAAAPLLTNPALAASVHACGPLDHIAFIWRVDQRFATYSKIDGYLSGIGAVAGLRFKGTITVPPASHIQEMDLQVDALGGGRQIYTE